MERVLEGMLVPVANDKLNVLPEVTDFCELQREFLQTMLLCIETNNMKGIQKYVEKLLNLAEFVEVNPILALKYYDRVIAARIIMNQLQGK